MLYEIKITKEEDYYNSYIYQSKNVQGQIIQCKCFQIGEDKDEFNFSFCIKSKRKLGFPEGQITGKDGIRSLVWAYHCLLNCIKFLKWNHPHTTLFVYGDTKRKQLIYKRYLLPLGFKVRQNRYKELVLKIDEVNI